MEMDIDNPQDLGTFKTTNEVFLRWLVDTQKATVNPKITIADFRQTGAGRAIQSLQDLEEDELLLRIPRESGVLTVRTSELSQHLPELSSLNPWLALILVLIYETRPTSPWKPYLDILPQTFDSLMFWAPSELQDLTGSAVLDKIGKEEADNTFRSELYPIVEKHPELFQDTVCGSTDADRFLAGAHRMGSIIMSYSFDLESSEAAESDADDEEEEATKAMVPYADLFNAVPENNAQLFQEKEFLEMRTTCAVSAGEELYNSYGLLPSSDLLRRYGYYNESYAKFDVVEIPALLLLEQAATGLDESDKQERVDYLLEEDILEDSFDLTAVEVPAEDVVIAARVLLMPRDEFTQVKRSGKNVKPRGTPEIGAALLKVLEARKKEYPTSIAEDEDILLREENLPTRKRAAVWVRLGEKRILERHIEAISSWGSGAGKRKAEEGEGSSNGKKVRR